MLDIAQIATATFDARLKTAKSQISLFMEPIVRVPLVVFVAFNRLSDVQLAYAYLLGTLAIAVISLILLSRERIRWRKQTLLGPIYNSFSPLPQSPSWVRLRST